MLSWKRALSVEVSAQADILYILHSNFISYIGYMCEMDVVVVYESTIK